MLINILTHHNTFKPKFISSTMGRIKSTQIKRNSRKLIENSPESFAEEFNINKKSLGNTLPSKRMRNKIAGYISRLKKQNKNIIDDTENGKK
jgi:ribosomal protein S17E